MSSQILLEILKKIAFTVSGKIKNIHGLGEEVGTIGAGGDKTKLGDALVERELINILPSILADFGIKNCLLISEETGVLNFGDPSFFDGIFIIVDPIDGSNNLRPHFTPRPMVAISLASGFLSDLKSNGTFSAIQAGVVKNIFYDDLYFATQGGGAFLNGIKLKTSSEIDLEKGILGLSLDHLGEKLKDMLGIKGGLDLLLNIKCQRRIGSTVLDFCHVATGDYDAHISLSGGAKIHDIAAAQLIIKEAGGLINIYRNKRLMNDEKILLDLYQKGFSGIKELSFEVVSAGNQIFLDKILKLLKLE